MEHGWHTPPTKYWPEAHWAQVASLGPLHCVMLQSAMELHASHTSAIPVVFLKKPKLQVVHFEVLAEPHVPATEQLAIAVHGTHTSAAPVEFFQVFAAHVWQRELDGDPHVTAESHWSTGVQETHESDTPDAVLSQNPFLQAGQLEIEPVAHWRVALQLLTGAHAVHARFEVCVQGVDSQLPGLHTAQSAQTSDVVGLPFTKNRLDPQLEQRALVAAVHVGATAQNAT